ncbi:FadR family transcriptional regulator [Saccharobesus litoralis]|uniref:FadR family transcriptional regulator n=1 Tax=Saccharobesus litoralis TaxID=2172099 RepID=A0A2S0VMX7_9ALTE|nr:FadR/GntR family transcriptional regulator [Saccharobesus litoralis]AWB65556.1 FadR family transcriptional regulator [Saccharobesus litoralis]
MSPLLSQILTIPQLITRELGGLIVSGQYNPNNPVPTEMDLSRHFGVSRSSIREAVKMLSAKGLIDSKRNQGIAILPRDNWNILDPDVLAWSQKYGSSRQLQIEFIQMRKAIEPEATYYAATQGQVDDVIAIDSAYCHLFKVVQEQQAEQFSAAVCEFHLAIIKASRNRFYCNMQPFLKTAITSLYDNELDSIPSNVKALTLYDKLVQAIKTHRADVAKNTMAELVELDCERIH